MNLQSLFKALTLVIIVCTVLPACQKCETCSYTTRSSNGEQSTYYFPETCGPNYKRQMQEETCQTMAAALGTTCVCSKN